MDEKLTAEEVFEASSEIGYDGLSGRATDALNRLLSSHAALESDLAATSHSWWQSSEREAALEAEVGRLKTVGVDLVCRLVDAEAEVERLREALEEICDYQALASTWDGYSTVKGIASQALVQIEKK